jgi:hypothetical protein
MSNRSIERNRGVALSLAREGAPVAMNQVCDPDRADRVVEKIQAVGGKAVADCIDTSRSPFKEG